MNNPNPSCEKECRFKEGVSVTTAAYYPPVYDKQGHNTNPDRNITTNIVKCSTCNR